MGLGVCVARVPTEPIARSTGRYDFYHIFTIGSKLTSPTSVPEAGRRVSTAPPIGAARRGANWTAQRLVSNVI